MEEEEERKKGRMEKERNISPYSNNNKLILS
jgi:hypothetical protein